MSLVILPSGKRIESPLVDYVRFWKNFEDGQVLLTMRGPTVCSDTEHGSVEDAEEFFQDFLKSTP